MAFLGRFFQLVCFFDIFFVCFVFCQAWKNGSHVCATSGSMYGQGEVVLGDGSARIGPSWAFYLHGNLRVPHNATYPGNKAVLRDHEGMTLGGTATLRFPYLSSHPGCNRHRQDYVTFFGSGIPILTFICHCFWVGRVYPIQYMSFGDSVI